MLHAVGFSQPGEVHVTVTRTFDTSINKENVDAKIMHCIAGSFHRVQFLQMVDLNHFMGLIFADTRTYTHYVLYNQTYFVGLILVYGGEAIIWQYTYTIHVLINTPNYECWVTRY